MSDTDRYAIGLVYTFDLNLTPLTPKDPNNKPIVTDKVYLNSVFVSYIDSGPISVVVENIRSGTSETRVVRSDYGAELGRIPIGTTLDSDRVYTETGRRLLFARGRSENINVKLSTSTHLGIRISAIAQEGTVIP